MNITLLTSTEDTLRELGKRVRDARIGVNLTQAALANRAGVGLSTVASLERGSDIRLGSMLSILRALGMLENANALVPETAARPSEIAIAQGKRKRASSRRGHAEASSSWTWGDEL